jgi:hypothetical protein
MRKTSLRPHKEFFGFMIFLALIGSLVWLTHSSASTSSGDAISESSTSPQTPNRGPRNKPTPRCPHCAPAGSQEIYIPLIDLPEAGGSEIVFNSRSPQAMSVTPIFYKQNGTMITGDPVSVDSAEIRYVNIKQLLPERYRHERDWGGFSLSYNGFNREMWSQFRFLNVNGGTNVDEFFTVKSEARANQFEAAWWMPEKSEAIVALGNITGAPTSAVVTLADGRSKTVTLAPHATEILRNKNQQEAGTDSVSISVTGPAGSIIPTGLVTAKDGSFNSVIRFYDPSAAKQPNLYGNGFRVRGNTPHMVLKNTSSNSIAVVPKFTPLNGSSPFSLPQVSLPANATTEVDLTPLLGASLRRHDLDVVSIEVTNWAAPGSVIGSLYGINEETGMNYDIPLRDSGLVRTMTGSYPWKIDNDFTTVVYITNISDQEAQFIGEINSHGVKVALDPKKLKPGETVVFDMARFRDQQTADASGNKLQSDATQGQFKWSIFGVTNGKLLLVGRAEMVSRSQHISTSYSCNDPCPPYIWGYLDPFLRIPIMPKSSTAPLSAWSIAQYDSGYTIGPYSGAASWSSDSYTVSVNPDSGHSTTVTGDDTGPGCVTADMGSQERYSWDGQNCYDNGFADPIGETDCTTVFTFTIDSTVLSIQPTGAGGQNTATITIRTNPRLEGESVHLSLSAGSSTGGHVSHSGTRPLGTLAATSGTTNELGAFQTIYTAPIFGGDVIISGTVGGIPAEQSVEVIIAVSGLSELGASADYSLVGQTTTHPSNHWGTATAITNLPLIASDYLAQFPGADILHYNDMSLIWGGKFDFDGSNWCSTCAHDEHRMGINCDVFSGNVPTSRWSALTAIFAQRHSPNFLDETASASHWHLRFQ